jgi:hypothetical protein
MIMGNLSDAELLAQYREAFDPNTVPNWNDFGGEIMADWQDAILTEMQKRGLWNA